MLVQEAEAEAKAVIWPGWAGWAGLGCRERTRENGCGRGIITGMGREIMEIEEGKKSLGGGS